MFSPHATPRPFFTATDPAHPLLADFDARTARDMARDGYADWQATAIDEAAPGRFEDGRTTAALARCLEESRLAELDGKPFTNPFVAGLWRRYGPTYCAHHTRAVTRFADACGYEI